MDPMEAALSLHNYTTVQKIITVEGRTKREDEMRSIVGHENL
jgi:hypothetical protein